MLINKNRIILPEKSRKNIAKIFDTVTNAGFECFLIGGSVRDLLLGLPVYDFDFTTNARPEHIMRLFKRVIPTGIKHGTVTVLFDDNSYEITTYRADGHYLDGRRPESITYSETLEQDVKRRDFTINGLAYDLIRDQIVDYVNGLADIEQSIIRTIGDPVDRFSEDGLRPLRACRFAAKLNYTIEQKTFEAISRTIQNASSVSAERVRDELIKMLQAPRPSVGLEYMRESGLLELFLPELHKCYGVTQNKYHLYDVYYHSLYSGDAAPAHDPIIRLAALLHDIGKFNTRRDAGDNEATFYNHEVIGSKIAQRIMRRLKFSNEEITRVGNLIVNHMFHYTDDWTDGAVRRFMRKVGLSNLEDLITLRQADRNGNGMRDGIPAPIKVLQRRIQKVIEDENAFTVKDLDINGTLIMERFSLSPGPIIGAVLNELLEMVLDNPELNNRDLLMEQAAQIIADRRRYL